jgi:AP-4 complex subunit epsilon-1
MGYLLCSLFFNQDSELLIMLISTIQKDLASTNINEIIIGLTALTKLMNSSIVGSVADAVIKLMSHQTDLVRKKALLVIEKIQRVSPSYLSDYNEKMKKGLCDREPSVMAAALNMYLIQTKATP